MIDRRTFLQGLGAALATALVPRWLGELAPAPVATVVLAPASAALFDVRWVEVAQDMVDATVRGDAAPTLIRGMRSWSAGAQCRGPAVEHAFRLWKTGESFPLTCPMGSGRHLAGNAVVETLEQEADGVWVRLQGVGLLQVVAT